uniref:Phosphoinositide phospholipase C n=1 Tax=Poecilia formosa TaxID=48698 RepID=A0A087X476_POEFO
KQKDGTACEKQEQASVGRVLEEFFWIGTSIVAFSKWRLGYMVEKCMSSMQIGTQMVKLRGGSKGLVRFFYLDEHKSCIRWRPSRKNEKAKISIDSIREVCEGKQSEIFQRYADGSFDPNCCFSLYYGEHMESLDLVSGTGEEARTWITGLKYLMAGISDEDSLAKRQRTRDQYPSWLKQTFTEADKNGDGSLSINEVLQLLHKLNVNLPRQKVKQMFKEADTDDKQGTLGFEEFCSFYKMMSTRRDLYLLMLTYSNHKDHLDTDDITRFLETEQKMTKVTKDHCLEIINKFEPCSENQKQGVLGIDGFTNYMRSPAGDIFNPEHYNVNQDMTQPLCNYFIASSHNTYLMGDQLMSQSRVDMYAWVLQAGCRCVEVDCWDGQDGEPIVHHGYTLTSKILFKDVIETINKYAFIKTDYPVILSIENHCSVPQQKKMAQYLVEILGDKLDVSSVKAEESGRLPSPESLRGKILVKKKSSKLKKTSSYEDTDTNQESTSSASRAPPHHNNLMDETSANRKQVENMAKKKLDNLMKESKIRDREDPDSFTIAGLPPSGKTLDKSDIKEASPSARLALMFRPPNASVSLEMTIKEKKSSKLKKTSSYEDTDTDQESTSSASRAPPHHNKKKKTMKLSRALSDLVKYTCSVGLYDIEAQGESANCSWQVSSLSETKAHQLMQQKAGSFIQFNQRQLSRIYPSSYRVDSSNFNPQPFWSSGCQLVALNYQSEGRVLQLNRAKFYSNGNCGYILKPACMCEGAFNPNLEDPLPGRMKKQLVLKIISGQQLPKPKDSMLGDRGEIIDPFVEVEIIGLPVDCCKEQTRVVDDNGFNPMWEETLVFTVHMPELALVRFLVWDHDPIGQDFIGQRTIAFHSMMPGYRHVYLEGMEEASIFVHVAVNDITGKARAAGGIKGLFHRNPKQASLDSHAVVHPGRKHPFGAHLLRRTASAPTRGQPKVKKGFPELAIDTKDYSSEGASEERESETAGPAYAGSRPQEGGRDPAARDERPVCPENPIPSLSLLEPVSDSSTVQESNSPPRIPSLKGGNPSSSCLIRSASSPEQSLSPHRSTPTPLHPPSAVPSASTAGSPLRKKASKSRAPSSPPQPVPVRRAKSEGHVLGEGAKPAQSAVPEVCTDATMNDQLWSKLEPGSHRDSMSSSSSISSNDTVIDLSLPNLARRSLCILPSPSNGCDASWMDCRRAAPPPCDTVRVSKSKSNPNLQQRSCPKDELKPRPLQPAQNAAGLKQASPKRPSGAATSAPSMSKSLGDLTSEDISCNFDSKYRSISRSFIVRPSRDVLRKGSAPRSRPQSDLTEQLRRLTDVEPLSPCDFIPEGGARGTGGQEAEEALVRRTSSRSQSRVRYIANRAKQAQERKRLQGLLQARSASFSFTGSTGSGVAGPMEERGNPEGACSVG